jgi:hypothetical protein
MLNPHAKPFYFYSAETCLLPLHPSPFVYPSPEGEDQVCEEDSQSDIMRLDLDTLTIILGMLSPTDIANMALSCKEMDGMIEGAPKISAVAEFYRSENERIYGVSTNLVSTLFAASYISDVSLADDVMAELVKGKRLTDMDVPFLIREMSRYSDKRVLRVVGVLRHVPGFSLCMKASHSSCSSPLHCACSNLLPGTVEVFLQIPETDVNIIVRNSIMSAPILHWILVKWYIDDMKEDARKKRILLAILKRTDLDISRSWKMKMLNGSYKAMEIAWDRTIRDEKGDLDAKDDLIAVLLDI